MRLKAIGDHNREVRFEDYITSADYAGATDVASKLQSAFNDALAQKWPLRIPVGTFGLGSTVTIKANMIGSGGPTPGEHPGDGEWNPTHSTRFKNIGINSTTTPMLLLDGNVWGYFRWFGRDFVVDGNYSAGVRNCIGLQLEGEFGDWVTERYELRNVMGINCQIGFDLFGWGGNIYNIHTYANRNVGLLLKALGGGVVEGGWLDAGVAGSWACRVQGGNAGSASTSKSTAVKFSGVVFQSTEADANGLDISEQCQNVSIDTCYFEGHSGTASAGGTTLNPTGNTFHLRVGAISAIGGARTVDATSPERAATNIEINCCSFGGGYLADENDLGSRVHFGNVNGLTLNSKMLYGRLETSSECLNVSGAMVGDIDVEDYVGGANTALALGTSRMDASDAVGRPALSLIVNPNNHGAVTGTVRGYSACTLDTSITIANEATITRDGINSLAITRAGDSTQEVNRGWRARPYGLSSAMLDNKVIVFTGWLYLPNATYGGRTIGPQVGIYTNGDRWVQPFGTYHIKYVPIDEWFQFIIWKSFATTGGYVEPAIYPCSYWDNPGATARTVYASDLALFVNPPSWSDVMAGRYGIDPRVGAQNGSLIISAASAALSGSNVSAAQGDVIHNTGASAGGYQGWVCTTAGSPGTWKTFGAISP